MSATSLGPVFDQDSVMEFGLDQVRAILTCRADRFEVKFHYTILVAGKFQLAEG